MSLFHELLLKNPLMKGADIKRYSGTDCSRSEDILQHTSQVALLSYMLGLQLKSYGELIDIETLLERAILHDIDECITGDVPRNVKYFSEATHTSIKEMSDVASEMLLSVILSTESRVDPLLRKRIVGNIQSCKEGSEGLIIKIVDMLCVAYKCHEEIVLLGNLKFLKIVYDLVLYLQELLKVVSSTRLVGNDARLYLYELVSDSYTDMKSIVDSNSDLINRLGIPGQSLVVKR